MLIGCIAGLAAGAFWGLVFALPKILPELSASQVALGRFVSYGILSAVLLFFERKALKSVLNGSVIRSALLLSLAGNAIYYSLLVQSVRMAGVSLTSLIIGIMPLSIAIFSSKGRVSKALYPALFMILVGVILINIDVFRSEPAEIGASSARKIVGVVLAVAALLLWTWYAVENAIFMKAHPEISGKTWTSVVGVGTLLCMVPIGILDVAFFSSGTPSLLPMPTQTITKLVVCAAVLGIGSSWIATWLWNIASQKLPTSLTGQLIVSETLFALAYGFLIDQRPPRIFEVLASIFLIAGVTLAIRTFQKRPAAS